MGGFGVLHPLHLIMELHMLLLLHALIIPCLVAYAPRQEMMAYNNNTMRSSSLHLYERYLSDILASQHQQHIIVSPSSVWNGTHNYKYTTVKAFLSKC